jgi:hypothetical protein
LPDRDSALRLATALVTLNPVNMAVKKIQRAWRAHRLAA